MDNGHPTKTSLIKGTQGLNKQESISKDDSKGNNPILEEDPLKRYSRESFQVLGDQHFQVSKREQSMILEKIYFEEDKVKHISCGCQNCVKIGRDNFSTDVCAINVIKELINKNEEMSAIFQEVELIKKEAHQKELLIMEKNEDANQTVRQNELLREELGQLEQTKNDIQAQLIKKAQQLQNVLRINEAKKFEIQEYKASVDLQRTSDINKINQLSSDINEMQRKNSTLSQQLRQKVNKNDEKTKEVQELKERNMLILQSSDRFKQQTQRNLQALKNSQGTMRATIKEQDQKQIKLQNKYDKQVNQLRTSFHQEIGNMKQEFQYWKKTTLTEHQQKIGLKDDQIKVQERNYQHLEDEVIKRNTFFSYAMKEITSFSDQKVSLIYQSSKNREEQFLYFKSKVNQQDINYDNLFKFFLQEESRSTRLMIKLRQFQFSQLSFTSQISQLKTTIKDLKQQVNQREKRQNKLKLKLQEEVKSQKQEELRNSLYEESFKNIVENEEKKYQKQFQLQAQLHKSEVNCLSQQLQNASNLLEEQFYLYTLLEKDTDSTIQMLRLQLSQLQHKYLDEIDQANKLKQDLETKLYEEIQEKESQRMLRKQFEQKMRVEDNKRLRLKEIRCNFMNHLEDTPMEKLLTRLQSKIEDTYEDLSEVLKMIKIDYRSEKSKIQEKQDEIEKLCLRLNQKEEALIKQQNENECLLRDKIEQQNKLVYYKQQIRRQKSEITELERNANKLVEVSTSRQNLKKLTKQKDSRIDILETNKYQLEDSIKMSDQKQKHLQRENQKLKQSISSLRLENQQKCLNNKRTLEQSNGIRMKEYQELRQQIKVKVEQLNGLKQNNNQLENRVKCLQSKLEQSNEQMRKYKGRKVVLEDKSYTKVKQLQQQLQEVNIMNQSLKSQLTRIQKITDEVKKVPPHIEEQTQILLDQQIQSLKQMNAVLSQQNDFLKQKVVKVQQPLKSQNGLFSGQTVLDRVREEKEFLVNSFKDHTNRRIVSTSLIFTMNKDIKFRNFKFIVGKAEITNEQHFMFVFTNKSQNRTKNMFAVSVIKKKLNNTNNTSQAMLFSLTNKKLYCRKGNPHPASTAFSYDYNVLELSLGSTLKIKSGELKMKVQNNSRYLDVSNMSEVTGRQSTEIEIQSMQIYKMVLSQ